MLLVAAMLGVPLVSLVNVDEAVPGVRVETSAGDERSARLGLERSPGDAVSRGRVELLGSVDSTTTESPTTTAAPTTAAIETTTTHTHPPTTTTAKATTTTHTHPPTTTTAKPTPTTAKPTTTTAAPTTTQAPRTQEGDASYYSPSDPAECAHRTLAFGTTVTVTNLGNGRTTTCVVGDRGPFVEGRVIDLSQERFSELAPLSAGVIRVRIEW